MLIKNNDKKLVPLVFIRVLQNYGKLLFLTAVTEKKTLFLEQCLPTNLTFPFVVTKTSKMIKRKNLFSIGEETLVKERESGISYKRQKPVKLYQEQLDALKEDKSMHVIDACSGAGSCGVACLMKGFKCIVIETSALKARLIDQTQTLISF